jgi:hypothetical protein
MKGIPVKYAKIAAAVAGSTLAAGVAAPAVAQAAMPVPTSVTSGVNALTSANVVGRALDSEQLDTEKPGTLAHNATTAIDEVNKEVKKGGVTKLLGGLPLGK